MPDALSIYTKTPRSSGTCSPLAMAAITSSGLNGADQVYLQIIIHDAQGALPRRMKCHGDPQIGFANIEASITPSGLRQGPCYVRVAEASFPLFRSPPGMQAYVADADFRYLSQFAPKKGVQEALAEIRVLYLRSRPRS